jgi:signal transduction histidine kinase
VSPLGRRTGAWSLAAAGLLGAAAILLVCALAFRSSGVLYPIAAGFAALGVLAFLGGRLAAPRSAPIPLSVDRRSDPPFETGPTAELEMLRKRLAETEGKPLKRIPVTDLSPTALEIANGLNARLDALSGTEKEQQQFIADVSHELRTPLTVLRGTLEVALEEERPAEEYREAIGNALLEIRHLVRISQNILFLARGESGRVTLSFSNQDLARFVAEVTRELQPAATDHDLDLSVDVPAAPVIAFVDPGRMQQVLHNLIENSMRYTPPGGSVRVCLSTTPSEARMEVSDTGVGIPEADLPFVFERFFRSDRARRAYTGGSGLGLSIVRWIVEAHKGNVEISSELDRGTKVAVRLPLVN